MLYIYIYNIVLFTRPEDLHELLNELSVIQLVYQCMFYVCSSRAKRMNDNPISQDAEFCSSRNN